MKKILLAAALTLLSATSVMAADKEAPPPALTAQEAGMLVQILTSQRVTFAGNELGVVGQLINKLNAIALAPPAK